MMTFMEKIEPPPAVPLTDDEKLNVILETVESENPWVKDFIDGLTGVQATKR
jgi:hypothetical protein